MNRVHDIGDNNTLDGAEVTDAAPEPDDEDLRTRQRRLRVPNDSARPSVRQYRVSQMRRR